MFDIQGSLIEIEFYCLLLSLAFPLCLMRTGHHKWNTFPFVHSGVSVTPTLVLHLFAYVRKHGFIYKSSQRVGEESCSTAVLRATFWRSISLFLCCAIEPNTESESHWNGKWVRRSWHKCNVRCGLWCALSTAPVTAGEAWGRELKVVSHRQCHCNSFEIPKRKGDVVSLVCPGPGEPQPAAAAAARACSSYACKSWRKDMPLDCRPFCLKVTICVFPHFALEIFEFDVGNLFRVSAWKINASVKFSFMAWRTHGTAHVLVSAQGQICAICKHSIHIYSKSWSCFCYTFIYWILKFKYVYDLAEVCLYDMPGVAKVCSYEFVVCLRRRWYRK